MKSRYESIIIVEFVMQSLGEEYAPIEFFTLTSEEQDVPLYRVSSVRKPAPRGIFSHRLRIMVVGRRPSYESLHLTDRAFGSSTAEFEVNYLIRQFRPHN